MTIALGACQHAQPRAAQTCGLDDPQGQKILWQLKDQHASIFNIQTHPCDGGIYIRNQTTPDKPSTLLWQDWKLQGIYPPEWDGTSQLKIRGEFLGRVDTAAKDRFYAEIYAVLHQGAWRVTRTVRNIEPPINPNISYCGGLRSLTVNHAETLRVMGLQEDFPNIDLARFQLVLYERDIRSGTSSLVRVTDSHYYLELKSPRIGVAYTQPGIAWMIVPNDARAACTRPKTSYQLCTAKMGCRSGIKIRAWLRWYISAT